ncbi:MAG: DUF1570 domain-containing protein [Gemmataceae bacterium]
MNRWTIRSLTLLGFVLAIHAQPAAGDEDWKYDFVYLKKGGLIKGLVVRDEPSEILMWRVSRKPGERAYAWLETVPRQDIESIEKLEGIDRTALAARVKALDSSAKIQAERMQSLQLKPVAWAKESNIKALRYSSLYFILESNAGEDLVRRAAVGLDQIYNAYAHYLPPRRDSGEPTTILLAGSLEEYQALLNSRSRNLLNPAFYNAATNRIACGSELQKLGDEIRQVRQRNQQLLADLEEQKAELGRVYKKKIPAELLQSFEEKRKQILTAKKDNETAFEISFRKGTERLMQRLYHESFHAYLANFVYPAAEANVPVWLNEGLAEIFDSAFLDGDELRIGHCDRERLKRAKTLLNSGELVSLSDLLQSSSKHFLVHHATEKEASDRFYLTSWTLAHFLTFERRLLGAKALDEYVHALHRRADPLEAFRTLVDEPLPQFEKQFHHYVEQLTPEGTAAKRPDKKAPSSNR